MGLPYSLDTKQRSVVVDLTDGWETYLAGRPRTFRKQIRVCRKRVAAATHRLLREADGGPEIIERVLELSTRSWKGNRETAMGSTGATRRFLRRLWDLFGATGEMEIYLLEVEGVDAASLVSIRSQDTSHGFMKDFNEDYSALSPGRFLVAHWLEDISSRGIKWASMLTEDQFQKSFSELSYPLAHLRLFPRLNPTCLWLKLEARLRPLGREWRAARRYRKHRRPGQKNKARKGT